MAWSEQARQAALQARRMHRRSQLYNPPAPGSGVHLSRGEMAAYLKDTRRAVRQTNFFKRSPALSNDAAMRNATAASGDSKFFTNVKGAHFADQGLKGTVWRYVRGGVPKGVSVPKWAATAVKIAHVRGRK